MILKKILIQLCILLFCLEIFSYKSLAQTQPVTSSNPLAPGIDPDFLKAALIKDINGDGVISIAAFGDSLTRGTGDFNPVAKTIFEVSTPPTEAGYPLRIEKRIGIGVINLGHPGERVYQDGLFRFAGTIPGLGAEFVIISEGANDARAGTPRHDIFYTLQTMINIAYASGATPILATIPPPCCNHGFLGGLTHGYDEDIRLLSAINSIALADTLRAFNNTCNINECYLLNLPEGLHPNSAGYDVMGETIIASLLNIDVFSQTGPAQLETALRLPTGSVQVMPDPVPVPGQTP